MTDEAISTLARWTSQLQLATTRIENTPLARSTGRITKATGLVLEATGLELAIGATCKVEMGPNQWILAEVVGFQNETLYLMPQSNIAGLPKRSRVMLADSVLSPRVPLPADDTVPPPAPSIKGQCLPVGWSMLGRVVDANGKALDSLGLFENASATTLTAETINPLNRAPITSALDVGVRAINGLLTIGLGQRMGLFAGSGVGKSVLLGMMARYTKADIVVVGLIGERGREVKEFIEQNLGKDGLARSVVVAAPADVSPLLRLQGAVYATRLAEFFRDEGKNVLLIMDSLTRYAMAQREIALAIGEPPATKGYPPSVFAKLPALVERTGMGTSINGRAAGSITAFYTVLTEGDDQQDPIADSARAILDGHIVLSRSLAESGHYPAIDIEASISRVMFSIVPKEQIKCIHLFKQLFSSYQRNRDLIAVGAYAPGNDHQVDLAIEKYPMLEAYLRQNIDDNISTALSVHQLENLFDGATL